MIFFYIMHVMFILTSLTYLDVAKRYFLVCLALFIDTIQH